MSQYLGRVRITANGVVLDSRPGATIDLGGVVRTPVVNDHAMGFSEARQNSRIEAEFSLKRGVTLESLRNIVDGTAVFECDTGQRYVQKGTYTAEPLQITGGEGGRVRLVLCGDPAEEVAS